MQPIIREKNDINFGKINKATLSTKTKLVLDWFMESSSSVQSVIEYDWSDRVGMMDKASDTEKAQSLANWIIKNRADLTLIKEENELKKISPTAQKRYNSIAWKAYTVMVIVTISSFFLIIFIEEHYHLHLDRGEAKFGILIPVIAIKIFLIVKKEKIASEVIGK